MSRPVLSCMMLLIGIPAVFAVEGSPTTTADWIQQGKRAIEQNDYATAGKCLSMILQRSDNKSSDPEAIALGAVVMAYGLWQQHPDQPLLVRQQLQDAIARNPDWAYPYYFLARVLSYPAPSAQIVPLLEKALSLDPGLATADDFAFLTLLYNQKGDTARAILIAEQGLERFPAGVLLRLVSGETRLAREEALTGFYELQYAIFLGGGGHPVSVKAKQDLQGLIRQYRNESGRRQAPELYACLEAFHWESAGDFPKAIGLLQNALVIRNPPHPLAHLLLGEAYLQNNQLERGIQELKLVVGIIPWFAPAYGELGDAYEALGEHTSAREWWQRCMSIDPTNWKAHQAETSLKRLGAGER